MHSADFPLLIARAARAGAVREFAFGGKADIAPTEE